MARSASPGAADRQNHRSEWICESCGFIYDPAEGDPDGGIPAGTAFDDIPADWFCPVCGARKVRLLALRGLSPRPEPGAELNTGEPTSRARPRR